MKDNRQVVILNLEDILPNRFQPRIRFDEKAIVELSESIKEHGVIQPIIVRKIGDKFEIIAGERRYKASVMAGKTTIPAIVSDLNDKESSEIALIENVQRKDLTPIEEAISYRKIFDMGNITQEELATKLGVSQSTIANKMRLLNLDDEVQDALLEEKISERHARSLLKLQTMSAQKDMLKRIINERLTVRKTDEEIEKIIKGKNDMNIMDSFNDSLKAPEQNNEQIESTENDNPFNISGNSSINLIDNNIPKVQSEDYISNVNNIEVLDFGEFDKSPLPANPIIEDTVPNITPVLDVMTSPMENLENVNLQQPVVQEEFISNQEEPESINLESELNQAKIDSFNISSDIDTDSSDDSDVSQVEENNDDNIELKPGRFFNILSSNYDESSDSEDDTSTGEQNDLMTSNMDAPSESIINNDAPFNPFGSFNPNINLQSSLNENINKEVLQENNFNYNDAPVAPVYEEASANNDINNDTDVVEEATLRTVINSVRKCADDIEKMGFELDSEEFDFEDIYQVIFKIKKK